LKPNEKSRLSPLLVDAKRFVLYNRRMIEEAPLQLYYSALIFAPSRSMIRQIFLNQFAPWLSQMSQPRDEWGKEMLVLQGHSGVNAVAFSPDSLLIASACIDNTVLLWNSNTGASYGSMEGHLGVVLSVAFSPNGLQLASASVDKTVRLWSVKTGAANFVLGGHLAWVTCLAFSPDGLLLASASLDKTVKLWNPFNGGLCSTIPIHSYAVTSIAFVISSNVVAVATKSGTIELCDTKTATINSTQTLRHGDLPIAAAFSTDGRLLAARYGDEVKLWDVWSGNACHSSLHIRVDAVISAMAVSPNNELLAVGTGSARVDLFDIRSGGKCATFSGHSSVIRGLAFSPNGQHLASASDDQTIMLWDAKASATHGSVEVRRQKVRRIALAPDQRTLAIILKNGSVELWDASAASFRCALRGLQPLGRHIESSSVTFSPNSETVAIPSSHTVELWDAATGSPRHTLGGNNRESMSSAYAQGRDVATENFDQMGRLYEDEAGADCRASEGHSGPVLCVAFSPDGLALASGSGDQTVRLWDVTTGAACGTLEGHSGAVKCIAFSPAGDLLASAADDNIILLWDRNSCALRRAFHYPPALNHSVALSLGSRLLACAADYIRLWDVQSGVLRHTFPCPYIWSAEVALSPDGQLMASAEPGQLRLWSTETHEQLHIFEGLSATEFVRFSTDGSYIETGCGAVRIPFHSLSRAAADRQTENAGLLCVKDRWLMRDTKRLLWLPDEYRPDGDRRCDMAIGATTATFCPKSGGLLVLNFDFQEISSLGLDDQWY
jgi:WD40 repeat protein